MAPICLTSHAQPAPVPSSCAAVNPTVRSRVASRTTRMAPTTTEVNFSGRSAHSYYYEPPSCPAPTHLSVKMPPYLPSVSIATTAAWSSMAMTHTALSKMTRNKLI
eukprot:scaffold6843_cov47-Cyclotella_meneghiniana.AAC.2